MVSVRCGYWSFSPVRTERPDTVGDATGDKGTLRRVYEQGGTHESPEAIRVGGGGDEHDRPSAVVRRQGDATDGPRVLQEWTERHGYDPSG